MAKTWLVSSMKNEGSYVLEWLAYYRHLGFDNVLIYTNDNTDSSVELFERLDRLDWFNWVDNLVAEGESPQKKAFDDAYRRLKDSGDWVFIADADEFLVLKSHKDIQELVSEYPDSDCFSFYWKVFGSSNRKVRGEGLVIDRFTLCSDGKGATSKIFKSLTRMNGNWRGFGLHKPLVKSDMDESSLFWYDGSGSKVLLDEGSPAGSPKDEERYKLGQVNHYMVKSLAEYRMKQARGNEFIPSRSHMYDDRYFYHHDINISKDEAIARCSPAVKEIMNSLILECELADIVDKIDLEYTAIESKLQGVGDGL